MSFSAVLLCGGESRRMGRDKALVEWDGRTLWEMQLEKLRMLQPATIFISARAEKSWRPSGTVLVLDETAARGPASGIAAALSTSNSDHLLALAIDLPRMTVEYLAMMLRCVRPGTGAVPFNGGRFEPVAAIYPRDMVGRFTQTTSLQEMVRCGAMQPIDVQPQERELFHNVNEPADLLQLA